MNAVAHCDPFPRLRQSGVAKQEDCETRAMYLFAFQWHFGCYKYQTHFHPDMTSGICLKKGGINPKHLRTRLEDSRHKMKVPECKRVAGSTKWKYEVVGWHLRSFMTTTRVRMKLASFSEAVFNTKSVNNLGFIESMREQCMRSPYAIKNEPTRKLYKLPDISDVFPLPKLIVEQKHWFKHFMQYVPDEEYVKLSSRFQLPGIKFKCPDSDDNGCVPENKFAFEPVKPGGSSTWRSKLGAEVELGLEPFATADPRSNPCPGSTDGVYIEVDANKLGCQM
jgi:hypothetical protein